MDVDAFASRTALHSPQLSATTARYPKSEQVAPSRFMLPVVSHADMGVSDTY